jgi:hypothetical protein
MHLCFVPVIGRYHIPRIIPLLLLQKDRHLWLFSLPCLCLWGYNKIPEAALSDHLHTTLLLYVHNLLRRAEKRQVVQRRDMPSHSGVSICNFMLFSYLLQSLPNASLRRYLPVQFLFSVSNSTTTLHHNFADSLSSIFRTRISQWQQYLRTTARRTR